MPKSNEMFNKVDVLQTFKLTEFSNKEWYDLNLYAPWYLKEEMKYNEPLV